ncbi:MAG: hypothetical protein H7328_07475 [Bdellovibrio sp.]|nr:hypothetical protein [Bdellovibrio sp.]
MLNPRSFSEIFEEIQSDHQSETVDSQASVKMNAGWETSLEPSHLAFLMGRISQVTPSQKAKHQAYPARPRPAHLFSVEEILAYENLRAHSPILNNNFNLRELRSAYRHSVLKTHPDQGGTAESFQAVKKSYQILLAFVNK